MSVAVVGTGFIGPVHVEALRRAGRHVRGILGSSLEKSVAASKALSLEVGYRSFDEVLADREIDVVHVTTPNDTHLAYAAAALRAGKHVVCEKPLATSTRETRELLHVARAHPHLVAAVNYNVRYYPMALQARAVVRSGAIGDVLHVSGEYVQDWLLFDTDWNWRVEAAKGGPLRAIGDIGTHWLDLMQAVSGCRVESLVADLATFVPVRRHRSGSVETFTRGDGDDGPSGGAADATGGWTETIVDTEDYGAVLLRLGGGARGSFHVSQVDAGRKNRLTLEIAGSRGSLHWTSERPNELWMGHRDRPNELMPKDPSLVDASVAGFTDYPGGHDEGFPDTFKQLYKAIYGYLDAGDMTAPKPFPTFEDGHVEVALCEAILASHRSQAWVDLAPFLVDAEAARAADGGDA